MAGLELPCATASGVTALSPVGLDAAFWLARSEPLERDGGLGASGEYTGAAKAALAGAAEPDAAGAPPRARLPGDWGSAGAARGGCRRLTNRRFLTARRPDTIGQPVDHGLDVVEFEQEGSPFGADAEFGALARLQHDAQRVRQWDQQQLRAGDRTEPGKRRSGIELQANRYLVAGVEGPFRVDETQPPVIVAGHQDEQIDPAVIGDAGRAMGEGAGAIVGVGAARPKTGLEGAQRARRVGCCQERQGEGHRYRDRPNEPHGTPRIVTEISYFRCGEEPRYANRAQNAFRRALADPQPPGAALAQAERAELAAQRGVNQ